jgi:predicted ATPase
MITKWGLKNFKSIREAELELAPLTILTGVNSSGKSSLLQSMAMLVQTTRVRNNARGITLKGEDKENEKILIDLGEFKNIYCNNPCKYTSEYYEGNVDSSIYIAFTVSSDEYEFIHYECSFDGNSNVRALHMECKKKDKDITFMNLDPAELFEPISLLENSKVFDPASEKEIREEHHKNAQLHNSSVKYCHNHFLPLYLSFLVEEVNDEDINDILIMLIDLLSCDIEISDSDRIIKIHDTKHKQGNAFMYAMSEAIFNSIDKTLLLPESKDILSKRCIAWGEVLVKLIELSKLDEKERKRIIDELRKNDLKISLSENFSLNTFLYELPSELERATTFLYDFFNSSIKYLGPLREDPKWKYKNIPSNIEIGPKGENTAAAIDFLNDNRKEGKIDHYFSPGNLDSLDNTNLPKKNFSVGLVEWLNYFSLSDDFDINKLESDNFDIKLTVNEDEFSIPQLGTGVSQVLPILVICLSAIPGSTIIIEQPELHLHPKMQSKLADFFIGMSLSGRQCIIETHSEYLIEQLNYRILKSPFENSLHKKIKVYFVTKRNGESFFNDMDINEFGAPSDWPEGFFDESHLIARKKMREYQRKRKEYFEKGMSSKEDE